MNPNEEVAVVFDCGSTNLRVAAVDKSGRIIAQRSQPNAPTPQRDGRPGWLIWDLDEIWRKLCENCKDVVSRVREEYRIVAAIVTTWGADGTLVKRDGSLVYPIISWQCPRTKEIAEEIAKVMDPWEIFKITGYQIISFNTLLKLMWLRKYVPEVFKEAYTWLMMPGLIVHKLTGEFHIDPTSASTMMAMDLAKRDWSEEMLALANLDPSFFPEWKEPGDIVGYIHDKAHAQTGLKKDLPVIVGGHDTQFAILAAGASANELVLSSGTWEILSLRMGEYIVSRKAFEEGIIIEADVEPGFWNPQLLMIASAVLEWIRERFYPELKERYYETMIKEALKVPIGSGGVMFIPSFVSDSGPTRKYKTQGTILGLNLRTTRAHIYRAALEGLSYQLRLAVEIMMKSFNLKVEGIRVVGGGSKNKLWNRIRADVLGLPVEITRFSEATVLGAALTAFKGVGLYKSFDEALKSIDFGIQTYHPKREHHEKYEKYYTMYKDVLRALRPCYEKW